jgi:hypothetical protein
LKQRPKYLRLDVIPFLFSVPFFYFQFGAKIFDREELVPVLSLMAAVFAHAILFFVNFWSADANVLISYNKMSAEYIDDATHVWVKIHNKK